MRSHYWPSLNSIPIHFVYVKLYDTKDGNSGTEISRLRTPLCACEGLYQWIFVLAKRKRNTTRLLRYSLRFIYRITTRKKIDCQGVFISEYRCVFLAPATHKRILSALPLRLKLQ